MRSSGADDGLLWCVQRQPKDIQDDECSSSRNSKEEGEKLYSKIMCARMRTTTSVLIQAWDQQTAVAMC